jgi:hypothetical protein
MINESSEKSFPKPDAVKTGKLTVFKFFGDLDTKPIQDLADYLQQPEEDKSSQKEGQVKTGTERAKIQTTLSMASKLGKKKLVGFKVKKFSPFKDSKNIASKATATQAKIGPAMPTADPVSIGSPADPPVEPNTVVATINDGDLEKLFPDLTITRCQIYKTSLPWSYTKIS